MERHDTVAIESAEVDVSVQKNELRNDSSVCLWCPPSVAPIEAYLNVVEARSVAELEAFDSDHLAMYGLVLRERILGPTHPATISRICDAGESYWDEEEIVDRCVELLVRAVSLAVGRLLPCRDDSYRIFECFSNVYLKVLQDETDFDNEGIEEMQSVVEDTV